MSRIHQRLFRPRSSSVSSPRTLYTASPILPASTSRPAPPTSPVRLPIDLNLKPSSESHQQAPFSLALAPSSGPTTTQPLLLSPLAAHHHHHVGPLPLHSTQKQLEHPGATHRQKRPRLKYHLDVGAYGIPKRTTTRIHRRALHTSPASPPSTGEDLSLAVQVGEDAYFIRENAMGIADGVGGWSRSKHPASDLLHPTPSALFAKRLMHHCAAELDVSPLPPVSTPPPVPWYWSDREPPESRSAAEALKHDLEDELEQLSEGIDVLQILERAYDQTLKSHSHPAQTPREADEMTGSSTALLAVLDHLPQHSDVASASAETETETETKTKNYAAGSMSISFASPSEDVGTGYDAAIRIVHVGDCMGMLVRDEDIVWRSEEMWWNYNTPVQLGPHTPHLPPSATAHTCVLPVKKDDILILASDGLSDNLWDEDVLDEVVRFKRGFLGSDPGVKATIDTGDAVKRKTLAGMLSEALCSRARRVSERRGSLPCHISPIREDGEADEVPFARRAREVGKRFSGGKKDDISVIVAVISPSKSLASQTPSSPTKTS